ncbi:hypothetical protein ACGFSB_17730 [Streptomyces sp. NPDC048441]|uniref:hypothetical protein n=1 Tax=Streptomyces sp. NPDC048441 TaxID=3365552 RepID=UPI00370F81D7
MTDKPVHPDALIRHAAEAIREFNHATYPRRDAASAIAYPGTAYHVIGAFVSLAQRLPQSLDQTAEALDAMDASGHLTADHGTAARGRRHHRTARRDGARRRAHRRPEEGPQRV